MFNAFGFELILALLTRRREAPHGRSVGRAALRAAFGADAPSGRLQRTPLRGVLKSLGAFEPYRAMLLPQNLFVTLEALSHGRATTVAD